MTKIKIHPKREMADSETDADVDVDADADPNANLICIGAEADGVEIPRRVRIRRPEDQTN